jgi:hypothetical protein
MFFGQFLLDEEAIDADSLRQALELRSKEHHHIGALAIEWGYLTEAQVESVHLEQRNSDRRFGELAIELDFLTRDQTRRLLQVQKARHKPVGEALVDLGVIDEVELDDLLDRYHLSLVDEDVIHLGLPYKLADEDLAPYLVSYFPKLFRRVTHAPAKLQGGRPWNGRSNLTYRVRASLGGDAHLELGLAACPALAMQLAAGVRNEPADDLASELIQDALCEFAQILGDAARRFLRSEGRTTGPTTVRSGTLPNSGFWFPASTPDGRGILVLKPT